MDQHFGDGFSRVRRPHGDNALTVTEAEDGVVRVYAHDGQAAHLRVELGNHLADTNIQPTQKSGFALKKYSEIVSYRKTKVPFTQPFLSHAIHN